MTSHRKFENVAHQAFPNFNSGQRAVTL